MSNDIVTFDIGGKLYRVSKSLLQKFPKTILCNFLSDVDDMNETIFVDGNGERFSYVLDYMMYQKVELPDHIGKESFLRDLEYYGFDMIELKDIETLSQKTKRIERMTLVASRCLASIDKTDEERFMHHWHDGDRQPTSEAIELGLHILWDSTHEEHESYHDALASILCKHNVAVKNNFIHDFGGTGKVLQIDTKNKVVNIFNGTWKGEK